MWHSNPDHVSNFAVFALSFLSCSSAWLLWTLRLHQDIRSGSNYLPPTSLPSPLCLSSFCVDFPSSVKKKTVLEEVPDCSRGRDAVHVEQWKADDTHGYTPALICQEAVWGEVTINLHILSTSVASASTGGGGATPANFFFIIWILLVKLETFYIQIQISSQPSAYFLCSI